MVSARLPEDRGIARGDTPRGRDAPSRSGPSGIPTTFFGRAVPKHDTRCTDLFPVLGTSSANPGWPRHVFHSVRSQPLHAHATEPPSTRNPRHSQGTISGRGALTWSPPIGSVPAVEKRSRHGDFASKKSSEEDEWAFRPPSRNREFEDPIPPRFSQPFHVVRSRWR